MAKTEQQPTYLEEMQDWQLHRLSPGHYTGGRTPHWVLQPGNPRAAAIISFVCAAAIAIVYGIIIVSNFLW